LDDLTATLITLSGDDSVITVRKPFVEFTGSLEAAMMLSQLLYWTPRSKADGWIAKTDDEWTEELCLTGYAIRKARKILEDMEVLETDLRKFKGAPTVHYRLIQETLRHKWILWIRKIDFSKSQNGTCENAESYTETTTEITSESVVVDDDAARTRENALPSATDPEPSDTVIQVVRLYEQEIGGMVTPFIVDDITDLVENECQDLERWRAAFRESIGARNRWKYAKAIILHPERKPPQEVKRDAKGRHGRRQTADRRSQRQRSFTVPDADEIARRNREAEERLRQAEAA
jgi:hypothetical protein